MTATIVHAAMPVWYQLAMAGHFQYFDKTIRKDVDDRNCRFTGKTFQIRWWVLALQRISSRNPKWFSAICLTDLLDLKIRARSWPVSMHNGTMAPLNPCIQNTILATCTVLLAWMKAKPLLVRTTVPKHRKNQRFFPNLADFISSSQKKTIQNSPKTRPTAPTCYDAGPWWLKHSVLMLSSCAFSWNKKSCLSGWFIIQKKKSPQNTTTKKKGKQQQTTKTSPSFGTTPRSRPPLKLGVPLGWNPWLCPVPNLARKRTTKMAVFGGIPSIFKGYHFLLNHFFLGGGLRVKRMLISLSWDLKKQLQKYVRLYYVWVLPWRKCRWKFGCPFAHAFAVHGSCTTPVWFQHPNKKSQGSTARFLRQPSLGSWCPFPTIPALKQEVSEAVDLC